MIIWVVGMPGAGKTTVAKQLLKIMKDIHKNTIILDGDVFREKFSYDLGYDVEARRINSKRLQAFCQFLDQQQINVICATAAMFPDILEENKSIFLNYTQVYLQVPFEELCQRDQKQLYSMAKVGAVKNVIGFDIPFTEPLKSDLILNNGAPFQSPDSIAMKIIDFLKI